MNRPISHGHCVRVSCSKDIDKATNEPDPGTYFLCEKNHSRSVEESFCSIPESNPEVWFDGINIETFVYDISNKSQSTNECFENDTTSFIPCNNNSYCCFSNNTATMLQERYCSKFSNCTSTFVDSDFTAEEENLGKLLGKIFIAFFLVIGLLAVIGNFAVIVHSFKVIFEKNFKKVSERQIYHVLILNLSVADFAMGVYVIGLIASSINYILHHSHGDESNKTEGTSFCLLLGVVNFAASQISVTAIATITGLRLFSVLYPYKPVRLRIILKFVIFTWIFWIVVALLPACSSASLGTIFTDNVKIDFEGIDPLTIKYNRLHHLLKKLLEGINTRCDFTSDSRYELIGRPGWETLIDVAKKLSLVKPDVEEHLTYLGYYNGQWVCTMKFFLTYHNLSSNFTLPVVLFNVFSFSFILIAQIIIARKTSSCCQFWNCFGPCCGRKQKQAKKTVMTEQQRREIENRQMHRRMFFIVITDFCCWIPLSLLTLDFYARSYFTPTCEFIEIARRTELWFPAFIMLVVPINSSINPFIYSFRFWKPFFKRFVYFKRFCSNSKAGSPPSSCQMTDTTNVDVISSKVNSRANLNSYGPNAKTNYVNEGFNEV